MGLFDKFKNKTEVKEEILEEKQDNLSLVEYSNYMLSDVRKEDLSNGIISVALDKIKDNPSLSSLADNIITISQGKNKNNKLYKVTNLEKNDSLKALKDGETYWGAIKKSDKSSKMAKLKEVKIDPTTMMMATALAGIEAELVEIKEISKKILSFLENEKESKIESNVEVLNRAINDFKFNLKDEKYLINNHKQVMEIRKESNENINFYKKQIKELISKNSFINIDNSMNTKLSELENKFKYYRLSLFTYSFSTLIEILLLGNYQSEYLLSKKDELDSLDKEYELIYNNAEEYIRKNANKSLEGNLLSGLGSAGKVASNLAEKVSIIKNKNIDTWLNEKGDTLKEKGKNIKENYLERFENIKDSKSKPFINQIEKINTIYNKTKEIYFDNKNIYLSM